MCFSNEMRDILPKEEKPPVSDFRWYVEDLLLAYKYDMKERYFSSLESLKSYLPKELYNCFLHIGLDRICWRSR